VEFFAAGWPLAGMAIASLFVAIGLWETARPERPTDQHAGRRWIANLGLYAISEGVRVAMAPLLAMLTAAASLSPFVAAAPADAFSPLHLVAIVLALDLAFYAMHRLMHAVGWLWRLHAIHHTDLALDVTTTVRHHPLEAIPIAATAIGIGALIGATPGEIAFYGVLAFAVQLLAHANVALPPRLARAIGGILVTPGFHRLHHSRDTRECHANYGQVFSLWDRLFGTAVAPKDDVAQFGVEEFTAPRFQTIHGILLQPVLQRPRSP
jgi:sterol desaturase/sphingolipid hydroxylase (fatty acid hydroxylase superfamily)